MQKIIVFSQDCERRISVTKTTGDQFCMEIATRFPLAKNPRWQRNVQLITDRRTLLDIAGILTG